MVSLAWIGNYMRSVCLMSCKPELPMSRYF